MTYVRSHRPAGLAVLAALAALCLAACGSSSGASTTSAAAASAASGSGSASSRRSAFAACLKSHGVTLPARPAGARRPPSGSGGSAPPGGPGSGPGGRPGFFGGGRPGGGFAANPKMRAAFRACGGQRFRGRRPALSHAAIARFAACVKQHGYTLPAANFSGKGPIYPARIERNKRFETAARACRSDLRPAGAPAPAGSPGTSTSSSTGT